MSENTNGIQVGQMVPDFMLDTFDPKTGGPGKFDLAAQKKAGKWSVLVFYPADYTFVCATEFADLANLYGEFTKCGAELVTVSTDTWFVHKAWQREEGELAGVKYPMGADRNTHVSQLFGVYDCKSGLTLRGSFIISPEGKLTNSEVNFFNVGRSAKELLRKLKANVYLAKHGDEACPANWSGEGDKTLKPGPDMVGRVKQALEKK